MHKSEIKNKLKQLGFSEHESGVYLALLEIGETSAGKIIKKTNLHRNVVYSTLDKLKNKKLVVEFNKGKIKYFKTLSVDKIFKQKEKEFVIAQSVVSELKKIAKQEKIEVVIYEGVEGFQNAHIEAIDQINKNENIYVLMAGGENFYNFMGEELKYFDKMRLEKNNKIKILALESRKKELETAQAKKRQSITIKYLPMSFINPIGSSIYGDLVLLFVYSKNPIVISVSSKEVAKAHREYFKLLWKSN